MGYGTVRVRVDTLLEVLLVVVELSVSKGMESEPVTPMAELVVTPVLSGAEECPVPEGDVYVVALDGVAYGGKLDPAVPTAVLVVTSSVLGLALCVYTGGVGTELVGAGVSEELALPYPGVVEVSEEKMPMAVELDTSMVVGVTVTVTEDVM